MMAPLWAMLLVAVAAPATPDCDLASPPVDAAYDDLAATLLRVEALAATPSACASEIDRVRGEALRLSGEPGAALPFLALAALASTPRRADALRSLGEAQAADGQPFEALRSLSLADRLAPASLDRSPTATLIARTVVRRGGTAWGSLKYAPGARRELDRKLDARVIAIGAGRLLVAGSRELVELTDDGSVPILPLPVRPIDVAVGPRGAAVVLLRDGSILVEDPRVRGSFTTLPQVHGRPRAIARDARDRVLLVASSGRIQELDDTGASTRSFGPRDVLDFAIDLRGGVIALTRLGEVVALDARGEVRWSQPVATAEWKWWGADTLASDHLGGVYVLAHRYGVIYALTSDGRLGGRIDPPPSRLELLRAPRGLVTTADGAVIVLGRNSELEFYR